MNSDEIRSVHVCVG